MKRLFIALSMLLLSTTAMHALKYAQSPEDFCRAQEQRAKIDRQKFSYDACVRQVKQERAAQGRSLDVGSPYTGY